MGIPDLFELGCLAQVVNTPMGTLRNLCVMTDPYLHAARPKCTANVNIEARADGQPAKPTDLEVLPVRCPKAQRVSARMSFHFL